MVEGCWLITKRIPARENQEENNCVLSRPIYRTRRTFLLAVFTVGASNGLFHIILASMHELFANKLTLVPIRTFHERCHNDTVDFKENFNEWRKLYLVEFASLKITLLISGGAAH